jgi:hypothetical protein
MICREGIYLHAPSKSKMAGMMRSPGINDDHAVTVVFGTLMLILITITVASGIAVMLSTMQKDAMDREEYRVAVSNEDIRIVSIQPEMEVNSSQWNSAKLTLLNLNTEDSSIKAISLNNVYASSYLVDNGSGTIEKNGDYPVMYNAKRKITVPAQKTAVVYLIFSTFTLDASEVIDPSAWMNRSLNYTVKLSNNPQNVNPRSLFPDAKYYYRLNNTSLINPANNYVVDLDEGNITLIGSLAGGTLSNNSVYTLSYNVTMEPFMANMSVKNNQPVQIKVISSYINTFEKFFTPPVPMAKVDFNTERIIDPNGTTFQDYIVLDASGSFDHDGYIVAYRWSVQNASGTYMYDFSNLSGVVARPGSLNLQNTPRPITIDLELVDDTGMVSRLSDVSGAIVIK